MDRTQRQPRVTSHTAAWLTAVCTLLVTATCTSNNDTAPPTPTPSIEQPSTVITIRFHDPPTATNSSTADKTQTLGFLPLAPLAPIEYTDVTQILVDVHDNQTDEPFMLGLPLNRIADDRWETNIPFLPSDTPLRLSARADNAESDTIFAGATVATLTLDGQTVEIPLAPIQDQQTFDMPRMVRIAYPDTVISGQEVQLVFTVEGNAGERIDYTITGDDGDPAPAAAFAPRTGTVTLTSTVADFITVYTVPDVTEATDIGYQVAITSADSLSAVTVATTFDLHLEPRPEGADGVDNARPSIHFNPVVLALTANGTETFGEVSLFADISDSGDPETLLYAWTFEPAPGTPAATFAGDADTNPAVLQNYALDVQGQITLAVTDEDGGTTTLHYDLVPEQFADIIDHDVVAGVASLHAGGAHTCARLGAGPSLGDNAGQLRCWGDAQHGQLGHGDALDIGDVPRRLPYTAGNVPLLTGEQISQLAVGDQHTCALLETGLVRCFGNNDFGQLGYGHTDAIGDGEPIAEAGYVPLGGIAVAIAAGGDHACALLETGPMRCWGRNDFGQLGHGHTQPIGDNEQVLTAGNVDVGGNVVDIFAGSFHTCAILDSGAMRCWGRNDSGQLGYGDAQHRGDDESLTGLPDVDLPGTVRTVAAGAAHTCALMDAGTLRCWGHGRDGRLGYGFRSSGNPNYGDQSSETPVALPDIAISAEPSIQVTDIAAGDAHTCAISSDGQVRCWGLGTSGRLGYGDETNLGVPANVGVDLQGLSAYGITAGAAHTCALRGNGSVRCWGDGGSGRLGHGLTTNVYTPIATDDTAVFEPEPVAVAKSCRDILGRDPSATTGIYTIDPQTPQDGGGPFQVHCDMNAGDGGWTLVGTIDNNDNHYWTYANRGRLRDGESVTGTLASALTDDFHGRAWHDLPGYQILFKADNLDDKFLRYDSILRFQRLRERYPATNQTVGSFAVSVVAGSWFFECGSLNMRLISPDSDANGFGNVAVGFIWQSINNNSCPFDDVSGGINTNLAPTVETWPAGEFYVRNFNRLHVFVR